MKEKLNQHIDSLKNELIEMSDYIFDNPEIGLKEYKASKLLCDYLEENGFEVERGVGGLETAFRAVYERGTGGPSFGLLCEYDALDRLGHACGHHTQGPAIIGTAMALKGLEIDKPFKVVIYGTPAEETVGGKIIMLKNGCFKDIDVALMMHLSPETCVDVKSMALSKYRVTYHGKAAHAALKPEAGRSAFDALLLSFQGVEFLREHVKEDTRMHYTVLDAGGAANAVPPEAVGSYYVRSYNTDYLKHVNERFINVLKGAAMMTGTTSDIVLEKEVFSKVPVLSLNDLVMENAELVGAPKISKPREKTGSTDFGNVMYTVPGTAIRMHFVPPGTSSHSQEYLDNGKTDKAYDGIIYSAKILAGTCYDLLVDEGLLETIQSEFKTNLEASKKI
ncbi:MAG: M20 family metallopeptidase [Tissierellia bacterium]|nr:M20 family metallopeptidase [Tissierellia bacterium]